MTRKEIPIKEKKKLTIEEKFGKIIFGFPVLHMGWEMDEYGFVTQKPDGKKQLVLTEHGVPKSVTKKELKEKIEFYKNAVSESLTAIWLQENATTLKNYKFSNKTSPK